MARARRTIRPIPGGWGEGAEERDPVGKDLADHGLFAVADQSAELLRGEGQDVAGIS